MSYHSSVSCADSQQLKVFACALIDEVLHASQYGEKKSSVGVVQ